MKLIKPSTAECSNRSRSATENRLLRSNNARSAKPHTNTCTTTTARNVRSCSAKFAHRLLKPTIVIKEQQKLNIIVHIARARCSVGKPASTSLFTNAVMITAHTVLTRSSNSTRRNKPCDKRNLHSSSFVTFIVNTYSKHKILSSLRHSNLPSTSERSITHPMCSD